MIRETFGRCRAPAHLFDIKHAPCRVAMQAENPDCAVDPSVTRAIRQAGAILADAGYEVVEVDHPSLTKAADLWRQVLGNEMRAGLYPLVKEHGGEKINRSLDLMIDPVPDLGRDEFLKVFAQRSTLLREWQLFFQTYPLVLSAVSWQPPFPVGEDQRDDLDFEAFYTQLAPTTGTPILGLPGLSAPMGQAHGLACGSATDRRPVPRRCAVGGRCCAGTRKRTNPAG